MQINLTGHHVDITDSLRAYVDSKLNQRAEATLHLKGDVVHANAEHTDMYAAIDGLIDKLDRQVIKHKEKSKRH